MLQEIAEKSLNPSEKGRRWFFSHQMDLILWVDERGGLRAFQLAYDKYRDEHLLAWRPEHGLVHYAVDDQSTPILSPNGEADLARVLELFRDEAHEVPEHYRLFAETRLENDLAVSQPRAGAALNGSDTDSDSDRQ
jgi:hypothetical protein